jgi:diguanylate cyclase (GGDEF)-like protein
MTSRTGRSDNVEWQLLDTLYNQWIAMLIGTVVMSFAAFAGWQATGQRWFLWWIPAIVSVAAGRVALERAYRRHPSRSGDIRVWRRRYVLGAWAIGAVWGVSALVALEPVPLKYQFLVLSVVMVTIMAAAARNAGSPAAARGQTLLALGPLLLACAFGPDPTGRTFCIPIGALFCAALAQSRNLHRDTLRLICVNEENLELVREIERANAELAAAAATDALTGIANRRRFDEVLGAEFRRAQRDRTPLALLLLDVDSFKRFNDLFGHQAGDGVLTAIAAAFAAVMRRPADIVARYGGEEFVAVLPRTDAAAALHVAERVRASIQGLGIVNAAGIAGVVTVSVGVVSCRPERHHRPEDYIRAADSALYAAKGAGRNCVRIAAERLLDADDADVAPQPMREGALS